MHNPYKVPYTVPAGETLTTGDGECHVGPVEIMIRPIELAKLVDRKESAEPSGACFPDYCAIDLAMPAGGFRNFHVIPAGAVVAIPVPDLEGCPMPNRVFFNWCGDCIIVDYDKEASIAEVADGSGPEINPRFVYIGEQGDDCERVRVISILNPGAADIYVSLQYNC